MVLKILNTHQGRPKNDVHSLYEWLFWDVEIVHDYDLSAELQRNDIWEHREVKRQFANFEKSLVLKTFFDEFQCLKNQFFNLVSSEQCFKYRWYKDQDYYADRISMIGEVFKDLPCHVMRPHLDNSHVVLQTIINLVDNPSSTDIYSFDESLPIYRSSRKKNQGITFFNNPGAVHGITNETDDRYILYSALVLG